MAAFERFGRADNQDACAGQGFADFTDGVGPNALGLHDVQIAVEGFVGTVGEDDQIGLGSRQILLPVGTPAAPLGKLGAVDAHGGYGYAGAAVFDIDVADFPNVAGLGAVAERQVSSEGEILPGVAAEVGQGGNLAALRILHFEFAVGKYGAGGNGHLLGLGNGVARINGYAAATAGGAVEDAAQREFGTGVAVAQYLPAAAVVQHLGIALAGYRIGIHPADTAVTPLLLQAGAQFVGEIVAGGVGVAQLNDAEFDVAAPAEPLQFGEPHGLPAAVVGELGFFGGALGGSFGTTGLAGEQAGGH